MEKERDRGAKEGSTERMREIKLRKSERGKTDSKRERELKRDEDEMNMRKVVK